MSAALVEALLLHEWPYNVRELLRVADQLRIFGAELDVLDLPLVADRLAVPKAPVVRMLAHGAKVEPADAPRLPAGPAGRAPEPSADAGIPPREMLEAALRESKGVASRTARALGCSRWQIYRWLDRYRIDINTFR